MSLFVLSVSVLYGSVFVAYTGISAPAGDMCTVEDLSYGQLVVKYGDGVLSGFYYRVSSLAALFNPIHSIENSLKKQKPCTKASAKTSVEIL